MMISKWLLVLAFHSKTRPHVFTTLYKIWHTSQKAIFFCGVRHKTESLKDAQWSKMGRNAETGTSISEAGRMLEPGLASTPLTFCPRGQKVTCSVCWYCKKLCLFYGQWRENVSVFLTRSICFPFLLVITLTLKIEPNAEKKKFSCHVKQKYDYKGQFQNLSSE